MKMMRDMIKGEPVVRKAYEHYLQQNPDFEDQSLQGAIKSITTELKNNPTTLQTIMLTNVLNNNDSYVYSSSLYIRFPLNANLIYNLHQFVF